MNQIKYFNILHFQTDEVDHNLKIILTNKMGWHVAQS
jgi:hypothetical protein